MAKRNPTDHFIDEVTQVADPGRTATYVAGAGGTPRPQPFTPASQSILLLGLPGSGCGPLASALGETLDMLVALLGLEEEAPVEAALAQAMHAMASPGRIFVLDDRLAVHVDSQALSFLPVVPVYVITSVGLCLQHLDGDSLSDLARETLRADLAARQDALEPVAMTLARHILRGEQSTAQQQAQLLEKLGIQDDAETLDLPF